MLNVISLGAGKQSTYMLLRALNGDFEFKPDYAIVSDTGCEPSYVYEYLEWLINYCKTVYNFDIIVVKKGDLTNDVIDYVQGKTKRVSQLPFFLGDGGFIMRQCTPDYKIAPVRKKIQEIRGSKRVRLWIGISLDEQERVRISNVKYIDHYYPLVDNRITIDQIIQWFITNGVPEPGKSACTICPFHSHSYWQVLKKSYPLDFEKACVFDDAIRNYPKLRSKAYLSNKRKPLREIDFEQVPSLFPELIEECYGLCGL